MRLVGKALLVLAALPLLCAGSYGLCAHYLPDAAVTDVLRDLVRAAVGLVAGSVGGSPHDLARSTVDLLETPVLRFSVAPAALVLLLAAALGGGSEGDAAVVASDPEKGRRKRKSARGAPSAAAAPPAAARTDMTTAEKRAQKKAEAQAKALARKGDVAGAAQLLFDAESFEKSCEYFIQAGDHVRAAEIRHDQNRFVEAAELYVEAGRHEQAGQIFSQQGEFVRAAECFLEVGSLSVAAEMFEQGGKMRRAAECYEQAEFLRHAAASYVKCEAWDKAADCLARVFRDETLRNKGDSKLQQELVKLARRAAVMYQRAHQPEPAMEILERAQRFADAGEIAVKLGRHDKAAELFQDAGDPEKAAESLRAIGQAEEASRILANFHRDRGDTKLAAQCFEEAGDLLAAGDLHRSLEDYAKAGTCFERAGEHAQAAEMFALAGDRAQAAACYERAGKPRDAAECYAMLGDVAKEAEQLEQAGELLRAGELFHQEGRDEEAISVLQRLNPDDPGFHEAAALLGDIFDSRGQLSLAIKKLSQAIGGRPMSRENLPIFYSLASVLARNDDAAEAVDVFEKILGFDYHYKDVEQQLVAAKERLRTKTSASQLLEPEPDAQDASRPARYQIVGELGRGGMGIVYKAKDTSLDRFVAYKVLPDSLQENPQALKNFLREAQAAAKLNHPNIVTVYDTGEQDGRFYIAMEHVDGTTLKEILRRRGAISAAGILHVLVQVCEALAYAHDKRVIHRDVKTANVMWTRDKKAKLMDFGLAKVIEEVRNHTTVVSGTPYYMSPEQTLGKNVDHRTDIYSLGVTLFEMATGVVPFKDGNIPYHHVHTQPPDVMELAPAVPAALADIINRCLLKDPVRRFQTAGEVIEAARATMAQTQTASGS